MSINSEIKSVKNIQLNGAYNKPMALDIFFKDKLQQSPVVVYAHGFNGFKDWGNFDIIAEEFAKENFVLVKFNFSHNGTTPDQPEEFADLEAFGNNNYSMELKDLHLVIDWVCDPLNSFHALMDIGNICLVGHSMGGGIAILQAATDKRITRLITWAGISECKTPWGSWPPDKIEEWKQTGVQYYINSRTKQQMPMYYQLYEDYLLNKGRLNIQRAIGSLIIPVLICHGTLDNSVPVETAYELKEWQPAAQLFTVESDHVFGRKHPSTENYMPEPMAKVVVASLRFLNG